MRVFVLLVNRYVKAIYMSYEGALGALHFEGNAKFLGFNYRDADSHRRSIRFSREYFVGYDQANDCPLMHNYTIEEHDLFGSPLEALAKEAQ